VQTFASNKKSVVQINLVLILSLKKNYNTESVHFRRLKFILSRKADDVRELWP